MKADRRMHILLFCMLVCFFHTGYSGDLSGGEPDSLNARTVYRSVYRSAIKDAEINDSEEQLLRALEKSLNLPENDIALIREELREVSASYIDQSGRWPLVLQNIVWAGGLYGWAIPYALKVEDEKWYVGMEMMSLSGAFYLTYQYTRGMELSHARAQMMRAGSGLGFRYGWGTNTLLDLWDESRTWSWVLMASVPAGICAGDWLYKRWKPTHGQSWSLTLWGEIGSYTVRSVHSMLADEDKKNYDREHTFVDLAFYPVSIWFGHRFFGENNYSFGDAIMLYQGRYVGWFYGIMLGDLAGIEFDSDAGLSMLIGGTIGGTLLMDRFIRGRDYTFGQSILSVLGTGSGALFAVGLGAIMEVRESKIMDTMVMSGGLAGLFLTDRILMVPSESGASKQNSRQKAGIFLSPTLSVETGSAGNYGGIALRSGISAILQF